MLALDAGITYTLGAVGIVAAALVTGFVTLRVSKNINAGSADRSDAATLWEASEQMRHDLVADILTMRTDVQAARKETQDAVAGATTLRAEAERARQEVKALTVVMIDLHDEVARLKGELVTLRVNDAQTVAAIQATRDLLAWFTENGIPPPTSTAIADTRAVAAHEQGVHPPKPEPGP